VTLRGRRRGLLCIALMVLAGRLAAGETVAVAAASNLLPVLEALRAAWIEAEPGLNVTVASGASGTLYAQITQGAPYDLFLSADTTYPAQLAASGAGDPASLRVFARGRLALWSPRTEQRLDDLAAALRDPSARRIALAQPRTAPYGRAAELTLAALGVTEVTAARLVYAENIAQAAQFVATGHADLGFVALSHLKSGRLGGTWIEVPAELHAGQTLEHAAILTPRGANHPSARRCLELLLDARGARILRAAGYLPAGG
jgi:molybdate transport system substrate-binding protein